jgi:ATP-binding cassette subfamily C protein
MLSGITLRNILLLVANRQVGYTAAQVATDLRLDMLRAIMRCNWQYYIHQPIGKLTNALATEASRSSQAFIQGATAITFLIQAIIYGGVALAVDWKATVVSLVVGSLVVLISHTLVLMAKRAGKKQTRLLQSLMSQLTDTLQSVKPLKSMAREGAADTLLTGKTGKLNRALRKQVFSSALLDSSQDQMFAILIAGGIYLALVELQMPFATVAVLVVGIGRMLSFFGKVQKQYQKLIINESAFWSLRATIAQAEAEKEKIGAGQAPTLNHSIQLDGVSFAYDNKVVFDNLSIECPVGSLTTLTGPSGAGKTTIIDLIIGLLWPQQGHVLIDGTPLEKLNVKQWRTLIGYVPQENLLLHDSIAQNVTLGDSELTEEDTIAALKAAGAWDFIAELPDGINSMVGERGGKFSGGQRQRIMIARALVHKPRLLILDEATSALDSISEQLVRETIEQLRGQLTILAISHQASLVEAADRVYKLADGKAILIKG